MAKEEFTVRITKKGEILIEVDGLPPRRVKDLMKYFEETLGPAHLIDTDADDAASRVEFDDQFGREEDEGEEKNQERVRE